jgi:hypothetical protein
MLCQLMANTHAHRQPLETGLLSTLTISLGTRLPLYISMEYFKQERLLWMDPLELLNVLSLPEEASPMTSL